MTIASAFNEIAVAQGGTASKSGAITAAIDALNDALAGSDQPQAKTIEGAVRLLGQHIGGGSPSTATATFVNNTGSEILVGLPNVLQYGDDRFVVGVFRVSQSSTSTAEVPLIWGGSDLYFLDFEGLSVTVSGAIDGDGNEYLITGDCTITISGE